ncbi:hypothetical protein AgCh_037128 [Apium graveolens]
MVFKVVVSPMPIIIDISPVMYTFDVEAKSSDEVPFIVPGFFIIGPCNDEQGLIKYATFVSARRMRFKHVKKLVKDVIESEVRGAAKLKTMDEINSGLKKFKRQVLAKVEIKLDKFGLQVYNAYFKQLKEEVPWYNVRLGLRRPLKLPFSKLCLKENQIEKRTFNVQATSSDHLPFIVPGFFIIGPRNDEQGLLKYATLVSARHMRSKHVKELVKDVIKSGIREAARLKTMDEINSGGKMFTRQVFAEVELELEQFGLQVYNANVKQLKEVPWYDVRLGWRRPLKLLFSKVSLKENQIEKQTKCGSVFWLWSLYTNMASTKL